MSLTVEQAKKAGALAEAISARQEKIDFLKNAAASGYLVSSVRVVLPDGTERELTLATLDGETSAQCIAFTVQIYEAQMAALMNDLAAI